MSYLSIINLKLIGELSNEMIDEDGFDQITDDLQEAVQAVLKKYDLEILAKEMMSHDLSIQNFSKCSSCSSWLINRTKENDRDNVDDNIKDGGEFESKILCCDCLPNNHKWHWQNIKI